MSVLLTVEAVDRASSVIGRIGASMDSLGAQIEAASARSNVSAAEMQVSQERAMASTVAYEQALMAQNAATSALSVAVRDLAMAEAIEAAATDNATAATLAAAEATGAAAVTAQETAAVQVAAAERASAAVRLSTTNQIVALDELRVAETLTATRSRELATAQVAMATESGLAAKTLKMAAVASAAVAIAVGVIADKSIKAGGDFQAGMIRMVTSAGESKEALAGVSKGVLDISVQTGTATDELVKGLYMIESAGFHGAGGIEVLKASSQGAREEGAGLAEVANAVTSALNSYSLGADHSVEITNAFVAATGQGKMKMSDLAKSLSTVLPIAAAAGININQVSGAIATMTAQGMTAQQSTEYLSHTIQKLQSPTIDQTKYMAQMGLDAQDVSAKLGERGLTGTLELIYKSIMDHMDPAMSKTVVSAFNQSKAAADDLQIVLKNMPDSMKKISQGLLDGSVSTKDYTTDIKNMGGPQYAMGKQFMALIANADGFNSMLKSGQPAALTFTASLKKMLGDSTSLSTALLLGGDHAAAFSDNVDIIAKASKNAGSDVKGWDEIQGTFNFKMSQLKAALKAAEIGIGTGLLPMVSKIAEKIVAVVMPISEWITKHEKLTAIILLSIGAFTAIIATILIIVMVSSKIALAFRAVGLAMDFLAANPIILVLAALVIIAILIATHWTQTKEILAAVWDWIVSAAHNVADFFIRVWKDAVRLFDEIWAEIGGTVKKWWPLILAPFTFGLDRKSVV